MRARLLFAIALFLLSGSTLATPAFFETLKQTYKFGVDSDAGKRACLNCHTAVPKRNEFGKQVEEALDARNAMAVTAELLHSIDSKDADGDGFSNGDELKAGFVPSDPASHPPKAGAFAEKPASEATPVKPENGLIPTHSFHPIVVHFPLALVIVGFLFDLAGYVRKESWLKRAGWLNLSLGLASFAVVFPTGIAAWLRMGWKLEGNTLIHLIFAVASLVFGVAAWLLMNKATRSTGYWVLAVLTVITISVAGHFGGLMVHGG